MTIRLRPILVALGLACVAAANAAAPEFVRPSDPLAEWPRDPVYVFYPRDSCQGNEVELEVWSRRAHDWVPHPVHPRAAIETCQLEDAGVLWNELRRRCVEPPGDIEPPSWIVGMNVFDSELTARCRVSHGNEPARMQIEVASPASGVALRADEPLATVRGQVLLDGLHGAAYDIVIAIDVSHTLDGDGRLLRAQVEAARAFVHRARPRLGDVRIGLVSFPGPDAGLPLGEDADVLDRALRRIAAAGTTGAPSFGKGLARALDALGNDERPGARKRVLIASDGRRNLPFGPDEQQAASQRAHALGLANTLDERAIALHLFALGGLAADPSALVREMTAGPRSHYTLVNEPTKSNTYLLSARMPFVTWVGIRNRTTGQQAEMVRYGTGGEFETRIPVVFGPNELVVEARSSNDEHAEVIHAFEFDGSLVRARMLEAERERMTRLRRERQLVIEPETNATLDSGTGG